MRQRSVALGIGLVLLAAVPSFAADTPPSDDKSPIRDLGIHVGRPFLQLIRRYGAPSAVKTVRLVAVAPEVKDATGIQWIYRNPTGTQLIFLIGENGRVLEATVRSAEVQRYRVEPESPGAGEKP